MKVFVLLSTTALLLATVNSGSVPKARSIIDIYNHATRVPESATEIRTSWQKDGRIIGGGNTPISDFPHQVSVRYFSSHICGGSIISPKWILTAAHCLDWNPNGDDVDIRAGSTDQSSGGGIYKVEKYILHPEYNAEGFQWDVAVIQIKKTFDCKYCTPIQMTTVRSELEAGKRVNVTGWGYTVAGSGIVPAILQRVEMPIVEREICNTLWGGVITDDMICAGEVGLDTCNGDSGGPLMADGVLFGVVSWMRRNRDCGNGIPAVFANIANEKIRNFIATATGL